jgi:hypothetical protein
MSTNDLPATVHKCASCKHPNHVPTVRAVAPTIEIEPPKRGDPIPTHHSEGELRNCHRCHRRIIPRVVIVPHDHGAPTVETAPPKRGEAVPAARAAA